MKIKSKFNERATKGVLVDVIGEMTNRLHADAGNISHIPGASRPLREAADWLWEIREALKGTK